MEAKNKFLLFKEEVSKDWKLTGMLDGLSIDQKAILINIYNRLINEDIINEIDYVIQLPAFRRLLGLIFESKKYIHSELLELLDAKEFAIMVHNTFYGAKQGVFNLMINEMPFIDAELESLRLITLNYFKCLVNNLNINPTIKEPNAVDCKVEAKEGTKESTDGIFVQWSKFTMLMSLVLEHGIPGSMKLLKEDKKFLV